MSPRPWLRFQLESGVRLALRAGTPLLGLMVAVIGLSADPAGTIRSLALAAGTDAGGAGAPIVLFAVLASLSGWGLPRLASGLSGWMRHLPASGATIRRSLLISLCACQAPALLGWVLLWSLAWVSGAHAPWRRLAILPVLSLSAALMVLPARRRPVTTLAGAMGLLGCVSGAWTLLFAGASAAVVAERFAGRVDGPRREGPAWLGRAGRRERHRSRGGAEERSAALVPARIAMRAVGTGLVGAYLMGAVPLGAAWLFVSNNRLEPSLQTAAARLGGGCAVTLFLAQTLALLAARRPVWAWSRSLPWSCASRILGDAGLLALLSLPLIVLGAAIDPGALLPLVAALTPQALLAAGAIRGGIEGPAGSAGAFLPLSSIGAAWVGISGWTALLLAVLSPWLLRAASRREARLEASRFDPRRQLLPGDAQSASGR